MNFSIVQRYYACLKISNLGYKLIDKAIVNRDKSITFQFINGKEIKMAG